MHRNIVIIIFVAFCLTAGVVRYLKTQAQQNNSPAPSLTVVQQERHETAQRQDENGQLKEKENREYALWLIEKWTAAKIFSSDRSRDPTEPVRRGFVDRRMQ